MRKALLVAFLAAAHPLAAGEPAHDPLSRLQRYLRIDTTNPPGNEKAGALYLKSILDRAGIPSELFEPAPGRASLYARLKGTGDKPGLVLHHHIDVVPAGTGWQTPPFAAATASGRLIGRGVLDDKGLGIAELEAFLALKGRPLRRDVVFLATADEETGATFGVAAILRDRPAWLQGAGFALGEGGETETVVDVARFFGIEIAQKSALWLRLHVTGEGGHAGSPGGPVAGNRLALALGRLASWERPLRLSPLLTESLRVQAALKPASQRALLEDLTRLVRDDPARARRELPPRYRNLLTDTLSITRLGTDSASPNVLPREAWAEVDARLPPETGTKEFLAELTARIADPGVAVEVLLDAPGGPPSPKGELYDAVSAALKRRYPGVAVGPTVSAVLSENRVFRRAGLQACGVNPFRVNVYDLAGVHGVNERIRPDWFLEGVETVKALVAGFAGGR